MANALSISLLSMIMAMSLACSRHFQHAGEKRKYSLYTPGKSAYDGHPEGVPLVVVLHGNPSTGWQMKMYSAMNKVARREGFAVVYPTATDKRWPIDNANHIAMEIDFLEQLLSDLVANHAIDPDKVFICGISGGGIFTLHALNQLGDTFAAAAIVAANLPKSIPQPLAAEPAPLLIIHGTADYLYQGTEHLLSVDQTTEVFVSHHDCVNEYVTDTLSQSRKSDTGPVIHRKYTCLKAPFEFLLVEGGGHHWPGAAFNANSFYSKDLGAYNRDFRASEAIWEFMSGALD